ncbi:hypothetical protein BJ742DRAFT_831345 [Cladochytrium replicatum]|nr:hypothetical protein BJ742DRAFT_831345 [Cladochytrium replicatum]
MSAYRAVALGFRTKDRSGICDLLNLEEGELKWVQQPTDTAVEMLKTAMGRARNHALMIVSQYENGGRVEFIGRMKHLWWMQRLHPLKANQKLVIILRGNFNNEVLTAEFRDTVQSSALQEFKRVNQGDVGTENFRVIVKGSYDQYNDEEENDVRKWVPSKDSTSNRSSNVGNRDLREPVIEVPSRSTSPLSFNKRASRDTPFIPSSAPSPVLDKNVESNIEIGGELLENIRTKSGSLRPPTEDRETLPDGDGQLSPIEGELLPVPPHAHFAEDFGTSEKVEMHTTDDPAIQPSSEQRKSGRERFLKLIRKVTLVKRQQ